MAKRDELRARWMSPDGLIRIEGLAREGLTDEQLADKIGIARSTFYEWCKKHRKFADAIKCGKAPVDVQVENALLKSALGHKETVKKAVRSVDGIIYVDEEIYYPPQTAAQIFWLKNRRPDRWRDKPPVAETPHEESTVDKLIKMVFDLQNAQRTDELDS